MPRFAQRLLALALLAAAASAPAAARRSGVTPAQLDRVERIAREVCPAAFRSPDAAAFVEQTARRQAFTSDEFQLLQALCNAYGRGVVDEQQRR